MSEPGVRVLPHQGLSDYHGAWIFRHQELTIISVPEPLCDAFREETLLNKDSIFTEDWIRAAFGAEVERIIGPAYQGYVDASNFRPVPTLSTRRLIASDLTALGELSGACEEEEWDHGGIQLETLSAESEPPTFGCFVGETLVAASQNWAEPCDTFKGGVITHPDFRNRGYGRAVRSAAIAYGVSQGQTALYQTLWSNAPAMALANALGFAHYATHYAVRFR